MELKINNLIPKMTDANFLKNIRSVGANKYTIINARSITLFGASKSRTDRKQVLIDLAKLLKSFGASYTEKSTASGAGHVQIGNVKIVLKEEKAAGGIILKPNLFGTSMTKIVDKDIPMSGYYNAVTQAIQTTKQLNDTQKELLMALLEDAANPSPKVKARLKKLMKVVGDSLPINTINNDYGEVLGPLAIMSRKLLPIAGKAVVFIPGRSNEPLLDYKITDSKKQWKISAKSGTTTNTLKPGDVIKLIEADGITDKNHYYKKWKNTPQYNVLKLLMEGTTKQGPINAGMWLKKNGYKQYFTWLKNDDYTEEIRQQAEDTLVKISREALDFTEIFSDATTSKVYYVKFRMSQSGDTEWKLADEAQNKKEEKKTAKRVVFRSKNFVGRLNQDKLGFQV